MSKSSKIIFLALAALLTLGACNNGNKQEEPAAEPMGEPTVVGHYKYQHAFEYSIDSNRIEVQEVGTMDFYEDGSALDSARQVYFITLPDSCHAKVVFDYVSPSRWQLEGDTLHFAGVKENFRMEPTKTFVYMDHEVETYTLIAKIIKLVTGSIDYEYHFHLDSLTAEKMQWSFVYKDGHSDTWEFYREL